MSESAGEKSFAPSAKRKQDAAKKGDVLRSRELGTAVAMLVGAAWLHFAGPWMLDTLRRAVRMGLTWDRASMDHFDPGGAMQTLLLAALLPVLVLGGAVMLASLASQMAFGEGRWIGGNLAPKGSRINPGSGLKRMFGPQGWIEMGKGLLKLALLGGIAFVWAKSQPTLFGGLGRGGLLPQLAFGWQALISLFFALSGGLVVIAMIDFPIQWLCRMKRLKMTLQDVRDEQKEAEGSPEQRAAQRQRQRQIAMGGVAHAMRQAQFVVTNPTHFAIALAYDPALAPAPVVLAKGRGEKALAMRELAAEHALPVLEYPQLARSLYYTTRERQTIREELYGAVAAILAFVLSLKRGEVPPRPEVDVPVTLRFDAEGRLVAQ
ncbi:MAG: EscU/YscU/HrcU family type III secretion system export apparatus switch protein [Novosphingobium sp.]|nr:EscU/YscU/HrcU family type III secretion system export apparatus switch protein [Novosphingobium sp.]